MDIFQLAPSIASGDTTFKFDFDAVVKEYIEKNPVQLAGAGRAEDRGLTIKEFLEVICCDIFRSSRVRSGIRVNNQ